MSVARRPRVAAAGYDAARTLEATLWRRISGEATGTLDDPKQGRLEAFDDARRAGCDRAVVSVLSRCLDERGTPKPEFTRSRIWKPLLRILQLLMTTAPRKVEEKSGDYVVIEESNKLESRSFPRFVCLLVERGVRLMDFSSEDIVQGTNPVSLTVKEKWAVDALEKIFGERFELDDDDEAAATCCAALAALGTNERRFEQLGDFHIAQINRIFDAARESSDKRAKALTMAVQGGMLDTLQRLVVRDHRSKRLRDRACLLLETMFLFAATSEVRQAGRSTGRVGRSRRRRGSSAPRGRRSDAGGRGDDADDSSRVGARPI